MLDENIRDQVVQFRTSSRLRVILLENKDLTLTTQADTAGAHEAAQLQARQMTDSKAESANAVKRHFAKKTSAQGPQQPVNEQRGASYMPTDRRNSGDRNN